MCVGVQCYPDITMPHKVLQGLGIHSRLSNVTAISVPAYMRRYFRKLRSVNTIVFFYNMLKMFFPMNATIGISFLSRNKNPHLPSIIGSTLGFGRLLIIRSKHSLTSGVIGIMRTPQAVLVSSMK